MSLPVAGTSKKGLFSQEDYLAPLPIPTGQKPVDMVNMIWRKNDVYLDIGNFNIGGAVAVLWSMSMLYLFLDLAMRDFSADTDNFALWAGLITVGIPALVFIYQLTRPTPLPIRFNRQRREVCVPREDGEYWIVPWETVSAAASQHSSYSQAGRNTLGLLFISFDNPDPQAKEDNKHFMWGFNCGGNEGAMSTWECIRSYMEIGPHALSQTSVSRRENERLRGRGMLWGVCCAYVRDFWGYVREGEMGKAVWLVLCIFLFGSPIIFILYIWKLSPPPDLTDPAIIEWSKPLPPEQWAKRSPELEVAIAQREAQLAANGWRS